jgi:sugar phosphate isomerase/epimerase
MMTSRRTFLKTGTMSVTAAILLREKILANVADPAMVGLQLYSVRDDMKKDATATLKKLASGGFKVVEHAGYSNRQFYNMAPADFKKMLDGLGMKMPSGHTGFKLTHWDEAKKDFTDEWKQTVEDAVIAGQQYIISPSIEEKVQTDYDVLMHVLDLFNKCGEYCQKSGAHFGYHNHNFEFSKSFKGKMLYDIILANTDAKLVAQQIDIGNMYGAGGRALDIIKKHPGRFVSMHVKDEIKSAKGEMNDDYESTILGKGVVGTKAIVDEGKKSGGTKYFIIEQESYQGKEPIACSIEDLAIMKKWGY